MKTIFIRSLNNQTISLTISDKMITQDLKHLIHQHTSIPIEKQLITFQGKVLNKGCIDHYHITQNSTLHLSVPLLGGAKFKRCQMSGCNDKAAKIVGDCRYCNKTEAFCSRHRLPESHLCTGIQSCKQEHFQRNSDKLMGEKCVSNKV